MKFFCLFLFLLGTLFSQAQDCPDSCILNVPNTLTSDCGGDCETLYIESSCKIETFHLLIYDKWGNKLFESYKLINRFSCADYKEGVYIWEVTGTYCNGASINKKGCFNILM
jgi:hypothetical protein